MHLGCVEFACILNMQELIGVKRGFPRAVLFDLDFDKFVCVHEPLAEVAKKRPLEHELKH